MSLSRRELIGLLAAALPAVGLSITAVAAETRGWNGLHVSGGRKGYADTPMGQVHYRVMGEGTPLLLLHQTPWFSVQYAKVQPLLAAANIQSIAIDTPGYGFSDLPASQPTIEDYANSLPFVLDALGIERAGVAGFHTGAAIGAAFAHHHSERTAFLIMDGAPLYTEAEREKRLSKAHWDQTPKPDGSHLSNRFAYIRDLVGADTATNESINWSVLSFTMAGEAEHYGHVAAYSYDMAPAIKAINVPTLIISRTTDSLHAAAQRILTMRSDFQYHEFAGGNSQSIYNDPEPWAEVVVDFVRSQ
jgi:pimeloyl-ACP methyl ester carboxylesterase